MATGAGLAEWEQTHGKKKAKCVLTSTGLLMEGVSLSVPGLRRGVSSLRSVAANYFQSQQVSPRSPSTPSFAMTGTMTRAAAGSAHHRSETAFRSKPPSRMADR